MNISVLNCLFPSAVRRHQGHVRNPVPEALVGGSAWVLRRKVLGADMVALTSSVKAPPTALNLLAREQPRAFTWGGSGDRTTLAGGEGKGIFGVSIMRHSIILIS